MSDANNTTTAPFCALPNKKSEKIISRIYVSPTGDIVVTDLWGEVRTILEPNFDVPKGDSQ